MNKELKNWTENELQRFETLTTQEQLYYKMMKPKSGVLYLKAKPGVAKSAMARSIADKMDMVYYDIRLSMVDETDVGLFPTLTEMANEEGVMTKFLDYAIPMWAHVANQKPTLIHFEELNRAPLSVRNAALQILLEREIGTKFSFNDNVFMMCSGNLGEEDGTDVEEFDNALNNRLLHWNHTINVNDWINNFANENVQPSIVAFIKNQPEYLYKDPSENIEAYATPRSWTFLSNFITTSYGEDSDPRLWMKDVEKVGMSFVGQSITRFIRFCEELVHLNINDIINRFSEVKDSMKGYKRDKYSELLTALKEKNIEKLTKKQVTNVIGFLKMLSPDELTGYLLHIIDNDDVKGDKTRQVLLAFKKNLEKIRRLNDTSK